MSENAAVSLGGFPLKPFFAEDRRPGKLDVDASSLEARTGLQEGRTTDGTRIHVTLGDFAADYLREARRRGVAVVAGKWEQTRHADGWYAVTIGAFCPATEMRTTAQSLTPATMAAQLAEVDALCDKLGIAR